MNSSFCGCGSVTCVLRTHTAKRSAVRLANRDLAAIGFAPPDVHNSARLDHNAINAGTNIAAEGLFASHTKGVK
jgi:hypothetical protein